MALLQVNLLSKTLMREVTVNVILPVDKLDMSGGDRGDKPFKTLYLLHGIFGNYTDWVTGTRIARFAEENDLCVVMPSGDNAFYVDNSKSHDFYGEFVGKELVELTRKMFPLSKKREDTFIGGLSMGGYGALRNGLKYNDTFGAIVALSSACDMEEFAGRKKTDGEWFTGRDFAESCFGDLDKLLESDNNPAYTVTKLLKSKAHIPDIYMACGESDFLLEANRKFYKFLCDNKVKVTFEVGPGAHEWDFWDKYIKKAIEWLPTENTGLGINSGNVK
ncbi:MAG: acetylesterase [Acetatifactor sp.]|nr:acetylesterase [Acetatifactor sp.]